MSFLKQAHDHLLKFAFGKVYKPSGLVELNKYFRHYQTIDFDFEKQEDGTVIAISNNFHYGSIITHARTQAELQEKIIDAILTAFEVPSSYAKEADVRPVGQGAHGYALA